MVDYPSELIDLTIINLLQAAYNAEYVIDAQSLDDRRDWVATLRYCIRESKAIVDGGDR